MEIYKTAFPKIQRIKQEVQIEDFRECLENAGGPMNILTIIILGIYIILGGGFMIALTGYMFVVIAQKIFRKIKYGTSLYA